MVHTQAHGSQGAALGKPVAIDRQACLRSSWRGGECHSCADACPIGALSWAAADPQIGASCVGCGRCGVACPTGAVAVLGFEPEDVPRKGEVVLTCARDIVATSEGAVVVPCLGGMAVADWLSLMDRADRAVQVLDRGWCANCPAGMAGAVAPILDRVRALLDLVSWPADKVPMLRHEPLAAHRAGALSPQAIDPSRRTLFKRLAFEGAVEAEAPGTGQVRTRKQAVEFELLGRLAARAGKPAPAAALPSLTVSDLCVAHGVCAAVCPTGALERREAGDELTLSFDPMRCTACGRCAGHCPEKSIALAPWGAARVGRQRVARHHRRDCPQCGESFAAMGDEECCPHCSKSVDLARAGFAAAFGSLEGKREDA